MKVLECVHVSKEFRVAHRPADRLVAWLTLGLIDRTFKVRVLKDVTFSLAPGDAMLIRGRNGCGKSTLLKLVSGILTPTGGTVTMNGRMGTILELGAGINGEASGRENARAFFARIDQPDMTEKEFLGKVEEFSELGEYFDLQVKHYSSGMSARLAFAGSVVVRPDLLIVDEALSVGDHAFQHKCINLIKEFLKAGTALILVSHMDLTSSLFNLEARIEDGVMKVKRVGLEEQQARIAFEKEQQIP